MSQQANPNSVTYSLPSDVLADLRTDHAGETGAVCIYRGILSTARSPALRLFAKRHMEAEKKHLQHMEAWLPDTHRSRLLPLWRVAGWLTGALPALIGPRAVYATVEAVETFVDDHYGDQLERLESQPSLHVLRQTLRDCQGDEVAHRDEAAFAMGLTPPGVLLRTWCGLVGAGSRAAVSISRYL